MAKMYVCDACQQECVAGWTEEEALAEAVANGFGGIPLSEMAQICDTCYQAMAKEFGFVIQEEATSGA
jgi:hypothetical protein